MTDVFEILNDLQDLFDGALDEDELSALVEEIANEE